MKKFTFRRGDRGDGCWMEVGYDGTMCLCYDEMRQFWRIPFSVKKIDVVLTARAVEESFEVTSHGVQAWGSTFYKFSNRETWLGADHRDVFDEFLAAHDKCFISVEAYENA